MRAVCYDCGQRREVVLKAVNKTRARAFDGRTHSCIFTESALAQIVSSLSQLPSIDD